MNALLEPYLPIDHLFTYNHLHALTYLISTYLIVFKNMFVMFFEYACDEGIVLFNGLQFTLCVMCPCILTFFYMPLFPY